MSRWNCGERFLVAINRSPLLRERIETTRASAEIFIAGEADLLWQILGIKKRLTNHSLAAFARRSEPRIYIRPINNRTIRITTTKPSPPLGP